MNKAEDVFMRETERLAALLKCIMPSPAYMDTAESLIRTFGSFAKVLNAKPEFLMKTEGMTPVLAEFISFLPDFFQFYIEECIEKGTALSAPFAVEEILKQLNVFRSTERFYLFLLDGRLRVVETAVYESKSGGHVILNMDEIHSEIEKSRPSFIIMAHNHPGGTLTRSDNDAAVELLLAKIANRSNARLLDSIIFTEEGSYSVFLDGVIDGSPRRYSV